MFVRALWRCVLLEMVLQCCVLDVMLKHASCRWHGVKCTKILKTGLCVDVCVAVCCSNSGAGKRLLWSGECFIERL